MRFFRRRCRRLIFDFVLDFSLFPLPFTAAQQRRCVFCVFLSIFLFFRYNLEMVVVVGGGEACSFFVGSAYAFLCESLSAALWVSREN